MKNFYCINVNYKHSETKHASDLATGSGRAYIPGILTVEVMVEVVKTMDEYLWSN